MLSHLLHVGSKPPVPFPRTLDITRYTNSQIKFKSWKTPKGIRDAWDLLNDVDLRDKYSQKLLTTLNAITEHGFCEISAIPLGRNKFEAYFEDSNRQVD